MTEPQHLTALAHGQAIRLRRAKERERVSNLPRIEGHLAVAVLLQDPPDHILTLQALKLLLWPHRAYRSHAMTALAGAGASETRTVGQLSPRQREALAGSVRGLVSVVDERSAA